MVVENRELLIFAVALILMTMNILVYSLSAANKKYFRAGIWLINVTAVVPGFLAVCGGLYLTIIENKSTLGWALFSAGILLETGVMQLSLMLRKKINAPGDCNQT